MNENTSNPLNELDTLRSVKGSDDLIHHFRSLASGNGYEALRQLNDQSLHFSTLFMLRNVIADLGFYRHLNYRSQKSLIFSQRVLMGKSLRSGSSNRGGRNRMQEALRWILESGNQEANLGTEFENVVDMAAVLLIKSYKDNTILKRIADIIFERNRRGACTYDLIWAAFESGDPGILSEISERLLSSEEKDVELAQRLLRFIPCESNPGSRENIKQKRDWIRENYNYLYYTGETIHQSCNPQPFTVSGEAKYLCKPLTRYGDSSDPLSKKEHKLLTHFSALDDHAKQLLSDYSSSLSKTDPDAWDRWLNSTLANQIIQAVRAGGGSL